MEKEDIILKWKSKTEEKNAATHSFLQSAYRYNKEEFMDLLGKEHQLVFSKIDCLDCGNCCKTTPPIYLSSDVKRIAKFLKIPPKTFKKKYIIEDIDGSMVGIKIPCHFLNVDNSCQVYEVRPKACRQYPHTDQEGFQSRPELNYQNTLICPAASEIVERIESKLHKKS